MGESGTGKSTIVSLILGNYILKKGELFINNNHIKSYERNSYYDQIALISYNTHIFNNSIRDNFILANENVTDVEIFQAL